MCDLYLGALNSSTTSPPTPFWTNPAITSVSNPSMVFTAGQMAEVNVLLQNSDGATGAMAATVNLWWSDPTTSFLLNMANQIGSITQSIVQAGAGGDAQQTYNFGWNTPAAAAAANGGHVCLAAVVGANEMGCVALAPSGNGDTANTGSKQVAIHNIHVNPAPPMPPPPPGPGGMRRFPWPFFFGASNGSKTNGRTRLVARAYNPQVEADQVHLWRLAGHPAVRHFGGRCAKFAAPASVHLAVGVESVIAAPAGAGAPQRLTFTGPVTPELADHLVKRDWVKSTAGGPAQKEVELLSTQVQQAAVWVEPHGHDGHLYAVEVSHELIGKGAPVVLGGLTVVFVPDCRPW